MSKLQEAAARVVAARNKPGGSWDDLKEAIGELEDVLKAPGGSAPDDGGVVPGMSLRDYFAIRVIPRIYPKNNLDYNQVSKTAYAVADAMLAARYEGGATVSGASPELLEVLKSFPGFTDDASAGDAWIEAKNAAIAKATGKEASK